jgi:phage tail sheath protein FI
MALLSTVGKAPGVYIQEITIPGPIAGVSTSVTAIVGPAAMGPLYTPTSITNFNQFQSVFGTYVENPYRVFATHAVNGFFNEGGAQCWFVRVGTGVQASLNLQDQKSRTVLVVTALNEGTAGNNIKVQTTNASIINTKAARETANIAAGKAPANQRTVSTASAGDAANFNPGDTVTLVNGANNERNTISSITKDTTANTTTFTMVNGLANDYGGGTIAVADWIPGQTKVRVASASSIEPGSYIAIAQGATKETAVVRNVDYTNNFLTLDSALANTYPLTADVTVTTMEFTLVVTAPTLPVETFANLSLDPRHSRYFPNIVSSATVSMAFADPPTTTPPTQNLPAEVTANLGAVGQGNAGVNEDPSTLTTADYFKAIDTLEKVSVNLLCIPDATMTATGTSHFQVADTQAIQTYMIAHCEKMQDRFAILDASQMLPSPAQDFTPLENQRQNLNSDNGYAALYFPWIGIANPFGTGQIWIPPSGHLAGVFATNDNNFGVYKAPANEQITTALAVQVPMSDGDQGPLNDVGINVLRVFPFQGVTIWGARTITPPSQVPWRFVNVRRLVTFIEKSIQDGTRFAVFEPNNLTLWQQVKRMVTGFLMEQWQEGALFGTTPDLAFRVRVDETLNPPDLRAQGIMVVEVTVVPTTPAEFIIFQVIQDITGTTLQESSAG